MKKIFILFLIVVWNLGFAQTLSVTATKMNDETCPGNGKIIWSVSGATGALTYSIINTATNSVVVGPTTDQFYSGLSTGSYKVVATQTGGNMPEATSNTITIGSSIIPLNYTVTKDSDAFCGADGKFTVNVSSGRAPYSYELLDASNNVTLQQTSNVFSNLSAGNYKARVVDQCGAGIVTVVTIANSPSYINYFTITGSQAADCSLNLTVYSTDWHVKYPLTMKVEYTDNGNSYSFTNTSVGTNFPVVNIPKPVSNNLNITTTITDACGATKTITAPYNALPGYALNTYPAACGSVSLNFNGYSTSGQTAGTDFHVVFTNYPAGFNPSTFDSNHANNAPEHNYFNAGTPLPPGTYDYQIIDRCGYTTTGTRTITNSTPTIYPSQNDECNATTTKSLKVDISQGFKFGTVTITAAPAAFVSQVGGLPYQIPAGKFNTYNTFFILNGLPLGNYSFSYTTDCDATARTFTTAIVAPAAYTKPVPTVTTTCSAQYIIDMPGYGNDYFFIQKYNPATGTWGKAGSSYTPGTGINPNNFGYMHSFTDLNQVITAEEGAGKYRIVANSYHTFGTHQLYYTQMINNAGQTYFCDAEVLGEFTVENSIALNNAYAFQCNNGNYDVAVSASGTAPLKYSLISDESPTATTVLNNGTNPIFHNLAPGIYYFRVTNACGNIVTKKYDIAQLGKPPIHVVPNCTNNTLKLQIDGLDYLSYEWYKADNPSAILSTTSVLDLGTYDATKAGNYKVRIYTTNSTYCINAIQEMPITVSSLSNATPGTGQTSTVSGNSLNGIINLNSYLTAPYDGYGSWTQVTGPSTALISGNNWNTSTAVIGTYTFKYTVTPLCGGQSASTIATLKLEKYCYKLPATASAGNPALPTTTGITLLSKTTPNTWPNVRNGGWVALEANSNGFVLNRVAFDSDNLPVGIPAANFVAGMTVFDTTNKCLKIYDGTAWSCYTTPTCPE